MTDELSNTNQLTADEMTVDTDASHTTPRNLTCESPVIGLAHMCETTRDRGLR